MVPHPSTKRAHWGLAAQFGTGYGVLPKVWSNAQDNARPLVYNQYNSTVHIAEQSVLKLNLIRESRFMGIYFSKENVRLNFENKTTFPENVQSDRQGRQKKLTQLDLKNGKLRLRQQTQNFVEDTTYRSGRT